LRSIPLEADSPSLSGLSRQPLQLNGLSLLLCLLLLQSVGLDSVKELLSTFRVLDVLDSDVDSLLHVSTVNDLVADDTDGSGGDVVDDTGFTVVV
jgi:hypothetical protein